MAVTTKNTKNARLLICATIGGTYVPVNKTHGLKISLPKDYSEDTSHGQDFKSYLPGQGDYSVTVAKWYDTAFFALEAASRRDISYYFLIYMDYNDTLNYDNGQCFFAQNEQNLDLGNTADITFDMKNTGLDPKIVRNGVVL